MNFPFPLARGQLPRKVKSNNSGTEVLGFHAFRSLSRQFPCRHFPYILSVMYTGIHFKNRNRISVFQFLLGLELDFGPFFLFQPSWKKMEQDFERIHGSKPRIPQTLFLFGGIPVYITTGLIRIQILSVTSDTIISGYHLYRLPPYVFQEYRNRPHTDPSSIPSQAYLNFAEF